MTAYFDNKDRDLHLLRKEMGNGESYNRDVLRRIDEWEESLVYDVTLCVQQPDFPEDLREAIHRLIIRYAVATQPVNNGRQDIDTVDDHFRSLGNLSHHLHTLFHSVAHRNLERFSDDPRTPMRCIYADGEEFRERLIEQAKTTNRET